MEQLWRKILGVPQDQEDLHLQEIKVTRKQQEPQKVQIIREPDGKVTVRGLYPGQCIVQTSDGKLHVLPSPQTKDPATSTTVPQQTTSSETAKMSAKTEIRPEVPNMFKMATTRSSTKYLNNDGTEFKPFFLSKPAGAVASSPRTPQISGKPVK